VQAKGDPHPLLAQAALVIGRRRCGPGGQPGFDRGQRCGRPLAPILPREIAVPVLPDRLGRAAEGVSGAHLAHQGEIGDRQRRVFRRGRRGKPVAIAEGVKLLDIAETLAGLALDPTSEADLQRAVLGLERTGGQRLDRHATGRNMTNRQNPRLMLAGRDNHRRQANRQRCPAPACGNHPARLSLDLRRCPAPHSGHCITGA